RICLWPWACAGIFSTRWMRMVRTVYVCCFCAAATQVQNSGCVCSFVKRPVVYAFMLDFPNEQDRNSMTKYDVYAIGNALVDMEFTIDDEFLAKLNIDKGVMTLVDEARQQALYEALAGH